MNCQRDLHSCRWTIARKSAGAGEARPKGFCVKLDVFSVDASVYDGSNSSGPVPLSNVSLGMQEA